MDRQEGAFVAKSTPEDFEMTDVRDKLNDLIETCRNGELGFNTAADEIEDASIAAKFRELGRERGAMAGELHQVGDRLGLDFDEEGTVAGGLHRGWIKLKAALTSGDHAILSAAEAGEDHAKSVYEDVLEMALPPDIESVVRRQYTRIQSAHDEVRELRDRTAA